MRRRRQRLLAALRARSSPTKPLYSPSGPYISSRRLLAALSARRPRVASLGHAAGHVSVTARRSLWSQRHLTVVSRLVEQEEVRLHKQRLSPPAPPPGHPAPQHCPSRSRRVTAHRGHGASLPIAVLHTRTRDLCRAHRGSATPHTCAPDLPGTATGSPALGCIGSRKHRGPVKSRWPVAVAGACRRRHRAGSLEAAGLARGSRACAREMRMRQQL